MKIIYFIEDKVRVGEAWKQRGEELGLFSIVHFLSPFEFLKFAKFNQLEKDSLLVADKFGPGFDNEKDFLNAFQAFSPNYQGKKILVSNSFMENRCPDIKGFDLVLYKRLALDTILELIKNEK